MSDDIILVERHDAVALVTLNRPDAMNALSRALRAAIVRVFADLTADHDIRAVVLTGAGRAFTAGVDLKEVGRTGFDYDSADRDATVEVDRAMADYPWPIIGAINGFAVTGGLEVALMCDVLLASESAKFADTHVRVGLVPTWGMTQRLPRLIGASRAKEMSLSGNFIDAATAERWGLVNRVYPAAELVPAALALAKDMAEGDPVALRENKALINEGLTMTLAEGLREERRRGEAHNGAVSADNIQTARSKVMERGRANSGT